MGTMHEPNPNPNLGEIISPANLPKLNETRDKILLKSDNILLNVFLEIK